MFKAAEAWESTERRLGVRGDGSASQVEGGEGARERSELANLGVARGRVLGEACIELVILVDRIYDSVFANLPIALEHPGGSPLMLLVVLLLLK